MRRIIVAVLLALASGGPTAAAKPAFDVGKFVPPDAVVYVTADGLGAVEGAAGTFLDNVMPGAGQILDGMLLGRAPAIAAVDRTRPVAAWMLASGATVVALPVRDAATFTRLARQGIGPGEAVTTVDGYEIVTRGGAFDPAAAGVQRSAAPPAIAGQVRGFVELGRVMAARSDAKERADLTPLVGRLEDLPRIDFALAASHERLELNAIIPAGADGVLAKLARPALPAIQNRFLDALPADAALVVATSAPERMAAVSEAVFASLAVHERLGSKEHRMARRMRRQAKRWTALSRGDSAMAMSMSSGPESISVVQAYSCFQPRRARILMHKMTRHLPRTPGATPFDVKYVARVEQIGDVAVDQLMVGPPAGTGLMREPIRYAFVNEAAVTTYGADGLGRMRTALAGIGRGVTAPEIEKAIPAGALLAVAVRPGAFASAAASGDEYATFAVVPRGTALDVRLIVPAAALPRGPGLFGLR
ncbi:MAG TPA: hypothetical protein VKU61_11365 [Candidatus Binatia bacterium]|nr:hypothetical protein [Candidatus Binatia bacterium]